MKTVRTLKFLRKLRGIPWTIQTLTLMSWLTLLRTDTDWSPAVRTRSAPSGLGPPVAVHLGSPERAEPLCTSQASFSGRYGAPIPPTVESHPVRFHQTILMFEKIVTNRVSEASGAKLWGLQPDQTSIQGRLARPARPAGSASHWNDTAGSRG